MTKQPQHIYGFTAENGVNFIAIRGEINGKPTIEFYDARYPNCQRSEMHIPAQFVSSYYIETLAEKDENTGLNLHGGVDCWVIDAASLAAVKKAMIN